MKRFLFAAAIAIFSIPAWASDVGVGVSIGIDQPGMYGRIDIGNYPRPPVFYPAPVIVQPMPVTPQPVYLHVPPGHRKNWHKHCYRYGACGMPVYFVQDNWYNNVYAPGFYGYGNGGWGGYGGYYDGGRNYDRRYNRGYDQKDKHHHHHHGHDRRHGKGHGRD